MTWLDSDHMRSSNERSPITKAVIPVAGLGTRFLPVTRSVPKALLPVLNIPLIQYAVDDAVEAGITDIAIVEDVRSVGSYFHSMPDLEGKLRQSGRSELADQMVEISSKVRITSIKATRTSRERTRHPPRRKIRGRRTVCRHLSRRNSMGRVLLHRSDPRRQGSLRRERHRGH